MYKIEGEYYNNSGNHRPCTETMDKKVTFIIQCGKRVESVEYFGFGISPLRVFRTDK